MLHCTVFSCNNISSDSITLHSFPRDESMRKVWINKCMRADVFNVDKARICSAHFLPSDYDRDFQGELMDQKPRKRRFLRKNAVPSVRLPRTGSSSAQPAKDTSTVRKLTRKRLIHDLIPEKSKKHKALASSAEPADQELDQQSAEYMDLETTTCRHSQGTDASTQTELAISPSKHCTHLQEVFQLRTKLYRQRREIICLKENLRSLSTRQRIKQHDIRKHCNTLLQGMFSPGQIHCIVKRKAATR